MAPFFVSLKTVNWKRLGWILTGFGVVWGTLVMIIPPVLFKYVSSILAAAAVAIAYFTRSGQWVPSRSDQPPAK